MPDGDAKRAWEKWEMSKEKVRRDAYEEHLRNAGYTTPNDEQDFAERFAATVPELQMPSWPTSAPQSLCEDCKAIPITRLLSSAKEDHRMFYFGWQSLTDDQKTCDLCGMIMSCLQQHSGSVNTGARILITPQLLMIEMPRGSDKYSYFRICTDPGSKAASLGVKIGFPALLEAGSEFHHRLVQKWVQVCNEEHKDHRFVTEEKVLPTRVIDVGGCASLNRVRLYLPQQGEKGRYIALSHRWGTGDKRPLSTERETIGDRQKGIEFHQLPQSFQDAVVVTRQLGLRYLWIDSLCIVQDDNDDWNTESGKMEVVFASAYCTIAATSAKDSSEGFLGSQPRPITKFVRLEDCDDSEVHVYVCEISDDFDHDLNQGELNDRAWVLQERALSPRTIHFTVGQTYWECGSVIRSESLVQMVKPLNLLGSSRFPMAEAKFHSGPRNSFAYEDVFSRYSKLSMTYSKDKPVAIYGLEKRLRDFYKTHSTYGIMHRYLHKCLLWQRAGKQEMQRISPSLLMKIVPSWSWMAYQGEILYRSNELQGLDWAEDIQLITATGLRSDGQQQDVLIAPLRRIARGCRIEDSENNNKMVRNAEDGLIGWIGYDCKNEGYGELTGCITVCRYKHLNHGWVLPSEKPDSWKRFAGVSWDDKIVSGDFYYVLLVERMTPGEEYIEKVYRRVGVAVIHSMYLSFEVDSSIRVV